MDNYIWQFAIITSVRFTAWNGQNVRCKQIWPKRYRTSIAYLIKSMGYDIIELKPSIWVPSIQGMLRL